ncbi:MAG: hypothetical protein AVDCRST_MAG18-4175, partial [uncultured Thermomicrobiales bacterium]
GHGSCCAPSAVTSFLPVTRPGSTTAAARC